MVFMISVAYGTRALGFASYSGATAACAWAWRRTAQKQAWGTLGLIQLILLLDLVFKWRWKLHDWAVVHAVADNLYDERRWPQKIVLALVFAAMIVLALRLWRHFAGSSGLVLAVVATIFSVALRLAELISWHKSDAILHAPVAGAMVVTFLWFGLGAATAAGAWIALRYTAFS